MLFADKITDSIYESVVESNRRREKQIRYNIENSIIPRGAQKSGKGQSSLLADREERKPEDMNVYPLYEDHYAPAEAAEASTGYMTKESIEEQIKRAKKDMERAAKSLDFLAASRYRDHMYELQKLLDEGSYLEAPVDVKYHHLKE